MDNQSSKMAFWRGFFLKNPILVRAIGVGPVIAAAYTLQAGVMLSVIMLILLMGSCLFGYFAGSRMPELFRAPINITVSAVLLIPSYLIANACVPGSVESLGVFAPLMMVNSILASYSSVGCSGGIAPAFADAMGNAAGFAFVTILISFFRELVISGTVWGHVVQKSFEIPGIKLPFAGFILLAFAAALGKHLRMRYAAKLSKSGGDYR